MGFSIVGLVSLCLGVGDVIHYLTLMLFCASFIKKYISAIQKSNNIVRLETIMRLNVILHTSFHNTKTSGLNFTIDSSHRLANLSISSIRNIRCRYLTYFTSDPLNHI